LKVITYSESHLTLLCVFKKQNDFKSKCCIILIVIYPIYLFFFHTLKKYEYFVSKQCSCSFLVFLSELINVSGGKYRKLDQRLQILSNACQVLDHFDEEKHDDEIRHSPATALIKHVVTCITKAKAVTHVSIDGGVSRSIRELQRECIEEIEHIFKVLKCVLRCTDGMRQASLTALHAVAADFLQNSDSSQSPRAYTQFWELLKQTLQWTYNMQECVGSNEKLTNIRHSVLVVLYCYARCPKAQSHMLAYTSFHRYLIDRIKMTPSSVDFPEPNVLAMSLELLAELAVTRPQLSRQPMNANVEESHQILLGSVLDMINYYCSEYSEGKIDPHDQLRIKASATRLLCNLVARKCPSVEHVGPRADISQNRTGHARTSNNKSPLQSVAEGGRRDSMQKIRDESPENETAGMFNISNEDGGKYLLNTFLKLLHDTDNAQNTIRIATDSKGLAVRRPSMATCEKGSETSGESTTTSSTQETASTETVPVASLNNKIRWSTIGALQNLSAFSLVN